MVEKPRQLTVVAEIATIVAAVCTVALLIIALYPIIETPSVHSVGAVQGGGSMTSPVLLGAVVLGVCTLIAGVLNYRASRRYANHTSTLEPTSIPVPPPPDPYAGVLSPLQLDALRLSGDLLAFLPTLEPPPPNTTPVEWRRIIYAKYALQFRAKAVDICQRLAAIGLSDHHFASLVDNTDSPENMADLARTLRRMAFAAFGD